METWDLKVAVKFLAKNKRFSENSANMFQKVDIFQYNFGIWSGAKVEFPSKQSPEKFPENPVKKLCTCFQLEAQT